MISDNIKSDYIREIHESKYDVLPDKEIRSLIILAQDGCYESKEKVIHANLRLVHLILKKDIKVPEKIFMDCVAVGNIALMRSVDLYNTDAMNRFTTYACMAIKRTIWKEIRISGSNIVLPQRKMEKRSKDENAIYLKEGAIDILLSGNYLPVNGVVSMDANYDNGEEVCSVPVKEVAVIHDSPLGKMIKRENYHLIRNKLTCLTDRERKVINERWLVRKNKKKTLETLSRELFVTRERIRQIEKIALNKLKKELVNDFD